MARPSRAIRPTFSTSISRSATLIRSCRLSTSSSSSTGTTAWAMITPVSTPASTTNRVAPVTLTPYSRASAGPLTPGNEGHSAGWVLTTLFSNRLRKSAPTSFMNPASTTTSGSKAATVSVRVWSQCPREVKSPTLRTKVGIPARSARASPSMSARSAPTATTFAPYAGSAVASISACRFVPAPETRTTRRAGLAGSDTGSRLPGARGPPAREPLVDQPADEAADHHGAGGEDQDPRVRGADVGHPPGARRAAREPDRDGDQHAGEEPGRGSAQGGQVERLRVA